MWIKIVLCTTDSRYAQRVRALLDREYGDKAEINIFSNIGKMLESIKNYSADLVLFGEELEQEAERVIPELDCVCGFLVRQLYESEDSSVVYIAKYQNIDDLYKDMLNAYSGGGRIKQIAHQLPNDKPDKIYMFILPNGGTGTTTIAKAFTKKCALFEKTLYLDMSLINCTVAQEGKYGFDEIIRALKSRRNILPLKLASTVSTDKDKFDTYAAGANPFGIFEMTRDDMKRLFEGIEAVGSYQKIIVDVGNYITEKELELLLLADEIICVVGNNDISRLKCRRLLDVLKALEEKEKKKVIRKVALFKNRTGRNELSDWEEMGCKDAGWAPDVHIDDYEACINKIAQSDAFDVLMQ